MRAKLILVVLFCCLAMAVFAQLEDSGPPAKAGDARDDGAERIERLPQRFRDWLLEVEGLIQPAEREVFLALDKDYQRDAFIRRFWQVRDPFPRTARNEFQDVWQHNLELARQLYDDPSEDRARMLLLVGEPSSRDTIQCSDILYPLELWYYPGTPVIRGDFFLVFYSRLGRGERTFELWRPRRGLDPLLRPGLAGRPSDQAILERIIATCPRGDVVAGALIQALDWDRVLEETSVVPDPGEEWVRTFEAYSTDLPADAATFPAKVAISFPGRFQSRTLVQTLVSVATADAAASELTDQPAYNFVLDGEILFRDSLFEHFRYRFNLSPGQTEGGRLPLVLQRYLRPGVYTLILKLEDLNGERFFRHSTELEVPRDPDPPAVAAAEPAPGDAGAESEVLPGARYLGGGDHLLDEANAEIATGDQTLKLRAPEGRLVVGKVRVDADTEGEGIARVRFSLNGKPVFSKGSPPYSVELDLGRAPSIHTVRAQAENAAGKVVASDEVVINGGPHRFDIRLIEPQRGKSYRRSLRAFAEVETPEGEALDRVELFLNETRVATLYQPPFVQPIVIPEGEAVAYVRAVAHLLDGNTAEDVVFVNAPDWVDDIRVQFVELYTSVLDRRGRPVDGLTAADFKVLENDVEQPIRRFERVEDVPIHAGILLDVSNSMTQRLEDAIEGAQRFFETVIEPKDRAAVITFNEQPELKVRFTNDLEVLAGGLAGVSAEGETALYDSLIYALYYFSGLNGKRAIILLSDGEDVRSQYGFEDAIDYARRTGVAVYSIGLSLSGSRQTDIRLKLQRLSSETGGTAYFIDNAHSLGQVYEEIQNELRSQYLLAYQSTNTGGEFRPVKVEVLQPGLEAKTMSGYFP